MKKTIITIALILVLVVAAYFLFRKKETAIPEPGNTGFGGALDKNKPAADVDTNVMPLKIGSGYVKGSQQNLLVKDIQDALNLKYKAGLITDGVFGPKTLAALLQNRLSGMIYWKQYAAITGKTVLANGKAIPTDANAAIWQSVFTF